jgi:DNA-binding transcriptional ArsR family regulator
MYLEGSKLVQPVEKDLKKHHDSIPDAIISAIQALQNPRRFSIAVLLLENGKQSVSYIGRATRSENGALLPQLANLEDNKILQNGWHDQRRGNPNEPRPPGGQEYSFFEVTPFGKELIETIATSFATKRLPLIKALSNRLRFALVSYMITNGSLSFSKIVKLTGLEKSAVAMHLNKLDAGGLVERIFTRDKDSGEYSMYVLTRLATDIIPRLLLLESFRTITTSTMNTKTQERAMESLRSSMEGYGTTTDADFCRRVLDMARTQVDAMLAAGTVDGKKSHAKQLASTCDALKKFAESFLAS